MTRLLATLTILAILTLNTAPMAISKEAVEKSANLLGKKEAQEVQKTKKLSRKDKRLEKKRKELEEKYKDYTIPLDAYMPVGDDGEKRVKITGSVEKVMELNLADCIELALVNNPTIKAAFASSEAVKFKKGQTLSNYSPQIDLQSNLSRIGPDNRMMIYRGFNISSEAFNNYTAGTIGISQLVYDFGITQNQYTIDKLNFKSSQTNIDKVVNELVASLKDGYYNLIYSIEARRVAQETLEQFEIMFNQAQAFYEVGSKPKVDVTIAQVNMEDARANLIKAKNNVDIAVSNLNNLMGLPYIQPYVIDTTAPFVDVEIDMKNAIETANEFRPELKIAKINVETSDQYLKLAKKTFMPSLKFKGNYSIGGIGNEYVNSSWWDIGGYLQFPTINPFLIRNQIKEARALLDQQEYSAKASVNDVYYDIQSTYVRLMDAKQRVPVSELAVKKAKENYELSRGRYKVGVSDMIEYKEAQIQYYDARLQYLSTLYEFNSAKANMERAIGKSIPDVKKDPNLEEEI